MNAAQSARDGPVKVKFDISHAESMSFADGFSLRCSATNPHTTYNLPFVAPRTSNVTLEACWLLVGAWKPVVTAFNTMATASLTLSVVAAAQ